MFPRRAGLTLIEVVVAILVFGVGGLGLAAGAAVVARQISLSSLRGHSASIARSRDELAHSMACGSFAGGEERRFGVRSIWDVSAGPVTMLDQSMERTTRSGLHADRYLSAVPCD